MPLLKILMYGNWKNSSWKNDFGTYFNGVGIEFICDKENLDTFIEDLGKEERKGKNREFILIMEDFFEKNQEKYYEESTISPNRLIWFQNRLKSFNLPSLFEEAILYE